MEKKIGTNSRFTFSWECMQYNSCPYTVAHVNVKEIKVHGKELPEP